MKIVTDGEKFAIEKGWFYKKYVDLYSPDYAHTRFSRFYPSCWGTKEKVLEVYDFLNRVRTIRPATQEELR
jgi:hypothetical protein